MKELWIISNNILFLLKKLFMFKKNLNLLRPFCLITFPNSFSLKWANKSYFQEFLILPTWMAHSIVSGSEKILKARNSDKPSKSWMWVKNWTIPLRDESHQFRYVLRHNDSINLAPYPAPWYFPHWHILGKIGGVLKNKDFS